MTIGRVVVIGAGVAGLAAARQLRAAGVDAVLIEAGNRAGGRAHTTAFADAPFDHGASWLHDAARNPLAAMAGPADGVRRSDPERSERVSIDGRPALPAEVEALDRAFAAAGAIAIAPAAEADTTLDAALAPLGDDPWRPLVALWEGAIIAAADAHRLGAADWRLNRLGGHNDVPAEGVGAFVLRKLGTPVSLNAPARTVRWDGAGVRVETPRGTLAAEAAIVTVSTGVLASGAIRFEPPLPHEVGAAVAALPMGLLSKVAFALHDRMGLQPDSLVMDRSGPVTFNAFPQDRPHLVGFLGGDLAWSLAGDPATAAALVRAEWERAMGPGAARAMVPEFLATGWGTDPLFLGAYSYAGPGDSGQRAVLAAAFPGERLLFAGEATRTDGMAGTVGGAFLSGVAAAERLLGPEAKRAE